MFECERSERLAGPLWTGVYMAVPAGWTPTPFQIQPLRVWKELRVQPSPVDKYIRELAGGPGISRVSRTLLPEAIS